MISLPPVEWLWPLVGLVVVLVIALMINVSRLRRLVEYPTDLCRYCGRRYPLVGELAYGRTCYRRLCKRKYRQYIRARDEAVDAAERLAVEREYGGTPEGGKKEG